MKSLLRSPFVVFVLGYIIWAWMAVIGHTTRWRIEGADVAARSADDRTSGLILASWHENVMLMPSGFNRSIRYWPNQKQRLAMMVSMSADGEAVAAAIRHLELDVIRGSSMNRKKPTKDKGGLRAFAEASKRLRDGGHVCVTPDGPRGPARYASVGTVTLGQRTGSVIVPYALAIKPAPRLDTWERFIVPLPFTRGAIVFGPAIDCAREADADVLREALQTGLETATREAEAMAGYRAASAPAAR